MNVNTDTLPFRPITLEEPEGQVPLNSIFYIERLPYESECYETIIKPGSLIRIKAPRQMGKSSLLSRILDRASQEGYQTACINFQSADEESFANLDGFLQWFCASLTYELNREDKLRESWPGVLGSKNKCTKYFQRYLLSEMTCPLALGLDKVDRIFRYPDIATEFFGLLRTWHERGKNEAVWKKLRLSITHSKEVYIPLNVNQSPFNVGLPIELPEFNQSQVEDLVKRHGLEWSEESVKQLMAMVGGHPYLVRIALYQIARGRTNLERLLKIATTEEGPYCEHLYRLLLKVEKDAGLTIALKQVVEASNPIEIELTEAFKLQSLGLVKFEENAVMPLCDLYRQYFYDRLHRAGIVANQILQPSSQSAAESSLAAIVFTDVVNSTPQMVANQTKMMELLKRDFHLMREICQQYHGQVLKSTGDGLLMYFVSAVKAVSCAIELQKAVAEAAINQPSDRVLSHRIGIHLGDVFLSGGDVLGAGVNIAARLQSKAQPGGICISQTVYEVVKNHLNLKAICLGAQELKGIPDPIILYQVIPG